MIKPTFSIVQESPLKNHACDGPETIEALWFEDVAKQPFFDSNKEHLIVVALNTKFKMIDWNLVSIGTVNESIAHPREIFRPIIAAGAYGFVLIHNHPSGETSPSTPDRNMTVKIREGSQILQLQFLDHVIVGNNHSDGFYSFRDSGLL